MGRGTTSLDGRLGVRAGRWVSALAVLLAIALAGCWDEPKTGPVPIVYGRDSCDLCGMIISDPRYATEIRGGADRKVYKFDDVGDAVRFLHDQDWKDAPDVEIWVMDAETGKIWLDGRTAFFMGGLQSPMASGYGAFPTARDGAIRFDELMKVLMQRGAGRFCAPKA